MILTCIQSANVTVVCEHRQNRRRAARWTRISSSTTRQWLVPRSRTRETSLDATNSHLAITSSFRPRSNRTKTATFFCVFSVNSRRPRSAFRLVSFRSFFCPEQVANPNITSHRLTLSTPAVPNYCCSKGSAPY